MEIKPIFNRLLIFDGSHCLHRNLLEPHLAEMQNSEGAKTGGVYGSLGTIIKETSKFNYFPVVVFDGHLSKRRLEIYPNYKRHEEKMLLENKTELTEEEELDAEYRRQYNTQRQVLKEVLSSFGIPVYHYTDWEGDDIIYILTLLTKDSIVVSDDKDLLQLVYEDENRRCRVRRGMRDEFIDMNYFKEQDMTIEDFIAEKAIVGDASDNIPSACYQVGEKTALGLWKLYTESQIRSEGFPKDEEQLSKMCKELNIPKRKAYLNFDKQQFIKNVLLTNLAIVQDEITQELLDDISRIFLVDAGFMDFQLQARALEYLQIKSINTDTLVKNVQRTYILADLHNDVSNVVDIIEPKKASLFDNI